MAAQPTPIQTTVQPTRVVPGSPNIQTRQSIRTNLVQDINPDTPNSSKKATMFKTIIFALIIFLGIGTGYVLANNNQSSTQANSSKDGSDNTSPLATTDSAKKEGIDDPDLFPDEAVGTLQANDGSLTNEGTHMLIREGGPDQTAFLTSSIVDLDKYIGKQVKIKGQTHTSQTAGWLLEVGWIEIQ